MKKFLFFTLSLSVIVSTAVFLFSGNAAVESSPQTQAIQSAEPVFNAGERLFGLTIDESSIGDSRLLQTIADELKLIRESQKQNAPPVVRLVLEPLCLENDEKTGVCTRFDDAKLDRYVNVVNKLKEDRSADVLLEIMDSSSEISQNCFIEQDVTKSVNCYDSLTKYLYNYKDLGKNVAIWEVGNEINMPEYGKAGTPPKTRRKIIVRQVKAALDWLESKGAQTAVTYYFNGYGTRKNYVKEEDSMMSWLTNSGEHFKNENGEQISFSNVDHVLISYYPDNNFYPLERKVASVCYGREKLEQLPIDLSVAEWVEIITEFNKHYSRTTNFGLGEVGTHCYFKKCGDANCSERRNAYQKKEWQCGRNGGYCPKAQIDVIKQSYDKLDKEIRKAIQDDSLRNRFIGGYFYWFYSPDVINKINSRNASEKNNAVNTRNAIIDVYQRWNEPAQPAVP